MRKGDSGDLALAPVRTASKAGCSQSRHLIASCAKFWPGIPNETRLGSFLSRAARSRLPLWPPSANTCGTASLGKDEQIDRLSWLYG
jgi:hypothetical protein